MSELEMLQRFACKVKKKVALAIEDDTEFYGSEVKQEIDNILLEILLGEQK